MFSFLANTSYIEKYVCGVWHVSKILEACFFSLTTRAYDTHHIPSTRTLHIPFFLSHTRPTHAQAHPSTTYTSTHPHTSLKQPRAHHTLHVHTQPHTHLACTHIPTSTRPITSTHPHITHNPHTAHYPLGGR